MNEKMEKQIDYVRKVGNISKNSMEKQIKKLDFSLDCEVIVKGCISFI